MNTRDSVVGAESGSAPMALVRSGVVLTDVLALPLLVLAFLVVLTAALGALGSAAGGLSFVLGLHYLDYFPTFPALARTMCGLSLLAFSALMASSAAILWRLFAGGWRRFWSWHHSAWNGIAPAPRTPNTGRGGRAERAAVWVSGLVFLGLFAVSFALMMLMARGPFWHAWRWFV